MRAPNMTCERALMILIGEPGDDTREELLTARSHASRCPRCSAAYDPTRRSAEVLRGVAAPRTTPAPALRVGLLAISVTQLVLAIPWLVGKTLIPDSHVAVSHLTRDGALGLVIAALGLVTVWRPRYVHSTRLIGLVVLALQLIAGIADQQMSAVSESFELVHFLVVVIVLGLFAVAVDLARRATPIAHARPRVLHSRPHLAPRQASSER
jgi:hypothetical protein